jgi:DNA polymerase-3 subunit gamma/tau
MSYLVLARKWRPAKFDQVIGQEGVVRTLKNALNMDRVAHAYLFCGARGVGKTSVARILAKALNCEHGPTPTPDDTCLSCVEITKGVSPDVFEIDGASNTGVDDVRSLRENSQYLPAHGRYKIYIIDEVHMLSTSAFNALLKTLEEPPAHVKFIFATTEPHKIPTTVLSRCQRFDFKRIPSEAIYQQLNTILKDEDVTIDPEGVRVLATEASGSMRDALSLTDQVMAFGGKQISIEQVIEALGLAASSLFRDVIEYIIGEEHDQLISLVNKLFEEGHDLKRFCEGLIGHTRNLILYSSLKDPESLVDALDEDRTILRQQSQLARPLRWHQIFDVLSRTLDELARTSQPRFVLETALLRLCSIEQLVDIDTLLKQLESLNSGVGNSPQMGVANKPRVQPADRPKENPVENQQAASPESKSGSSEDLTEWERLVQMISRRRPSLGSILNHACPVELTPKKICISFEPGSFFHDQMKSDRNKRDLLRFCKEFFGTEPVLQVESKQPGEGTTLAQSKEEAKADAENDMREQALSHPAVKEAVRIFGAEVEQIRPSTGRDS